MRFYRFYKKDNLRASIPEILALLAWAEISGVTGSLNVAKVKVK